MLTFSLQGPGRSSEGAAAAAAISEAMSGYGGQGSKVHTHVVQVIEANGQWYAQVRISVEPVLEEKADKPVLNPAVKKQKPESIKRKLETEKKLHPHKKLEKPSMRPEPQRELAPDVHVYLYSPQVPDVSYSKHLFEPHPEYRYHFISDRSIWEATKKIFPDIDLYEAAHPLFQLDLAGQSEGPTLDLNFQRKRRPKGLALDLDQEEKF
jgi:hypothetical protein